MLDLGDRFLRHVERTKLLLHLVDVSSVSGRDTVTDYLTVNRELASYNPELAVRPQFVIATKMDALDDPQRLESLREKAETDGKRFFAISSATGEGVRELINAVATKLDELNSSDRSADSVNWFCEMCAKKRIGLYGGTFDPVHLGHLDIARKVLELFEIEQVLFLPAQVAPHKLGRPVTPPLHRYAMLALTTQDDPKLAISTFEIEAPNRRYTVDTLAHFVAQVGDSSELFFIMGADSWTEITTWREWQKLLTMTNHIIVTRPGFDLDGPAEFRDRIIDLREKTTAATVVESAEKRIYLTDVVMRDVSATQIRELAAAKRFADLATLVPPAVAQYIEKYRIYQESNEV